MSTPQRSRRIAQVLLAIAACFHLTLLLSLTTYARTTEATSQSAATTLRVTAWRRPDYPAAARRAGAVGKIVIEFSVSETAIVAGLRAVSGPNSLRAAAEAAARDWRFAFTEGAPTATSTVRVTFDFAEELGHHYASLDLIEDPRIETPLPWPMPPAARAESAGSSGSGRERPARGLRLPRIPEGQEGVTLLPRNPDPNRLGDTEVSETPSNDAPSAESDRAGTPVRILSRPKPQYTERARQNRTEGVVSLLVLFGADGAVKDVGVLGGLPDGLGRSAVEAAKSIRFAPARDAGARARDRLELVTFMFALQ